MKSPRPRRPATAYKWFLHHARRDGLSDLEARRVAMAKMNARYNKRESTTPARTPPRVKRAKKRSTIRKVVCSTKREKLRDIERKVELSRRLMEQLMLAQKRGEDTSRFVQQARAEGIEVDDANGTEKVEQNFEANEYPRAIKIRSGANVRCLDVRLEFKAPPLPDVLDVGKLSNDLQFHLEMDASFDKALREEYAVAFDSWDLPSNTPCSTSLEMFLDGLP